MVDEHKRLVCIAFFKCCRLSHNIETVSIPALPVVNDFDDHEYGRECGPLNSNKNGTRSAPTV